MRITPDIMAAAYDFLRTTAPFKQWKLPPSDHVEFHVSHKRGLLGEAWYAGADVPAIAVSERGVSHTTTLIRVMAHEMVHISTREAFLHSEEFHRRAASVCRHHGFDPKEF